MLQRIDSGNTTQYAVLDFEYYRNLSENNFLVMSYFKNSNNNNETMCQWHLATMSENGETFTPINRLGSCYIQDEDQVDGWIERATQLLG